MNWYSHLFKKFPQFVVLSPMVYPALYFLSDHCMYEGYLFQNINFVPSNTFLYSPVCNRFSVFGPPWGSLSSDFYTIPFIPSI